MTVQHANIAEAHLHESKGVSTASAEEVYHADGLGSGTWRKVTDASIDSETAVYGEQPTSNGDGTTSFGTLVWKDLIGDVVPKTSGVGAPTLATWRAGNTRAFAYSAGDDGDIVFHMPHDYAPGTDIYLHMHWGHHGTAISGNLVVNYYVSYAKGHDQANFSAEINPTFTYNTTNIVTTPQYRHRIEELQLSAATPTAAQLDTDDLEPDALILVHYDVTTIPTITGGATNEPFIFTVDIHYQANKEGTKNKAPNFNA